MALPEEEQQDSDNSVCVKELEGTSLACGSNRDLVSSDPTPSPASDPDLLNEQAILCKYLDTIDSDSDVVVSGARLYCVCSNCKHPPKKEGTLNVVCAVILPPTAVSGARGRIGTLTSLLVPCAQEVNTVKAYILCHKNLYIFVNQVFFLQFYSSAHYFSYIY